MIQIAGVLLVQDNHYVLQHRDDIPTIAQPGKVSVWGGTFDPAERAVDCAKRELREETGVMVDASELELLEDYDIISTGPKTAGQPAHIYLYVTKLTHNKKVQCFEGQGIVRVAVGKTDSRMTIYTTKAIKLYEAKIR